MNIERKGDWIIVKCKFLEKDIPNYEEMGISSPKANHEEIGSFRFNYHHLIAYNSSGANNENFAVIRLTNDDYNLDVSFEEFDKFILEQKD